MRRFASLLLVSLLAGSPAFAQHEGDAPGMIRLSDLLAQFGDDAQAVEMVMAKLGQNPAAAGLLSQDQKAFIVAAVRSRDWAALDRFPAVTVAEMGRTIRAVGAAQQARAARVAAGQAGQGAGLARGQDQGLGGGLPGGPLLPAPARGVEPLGIPTHGAPAGAELKDLGQGLSFGDEVDPDLAARSADSARLADVLNRLALADGLRVDAGGGVVVDSPRALVAALEAAGHQVEVRDFRTFANFGDLHYQGTDVATPFWVDTEVALPGQDRNLFVPVSHSQHELHVRGPAVNADVSFFFGIDGEAKFRAMTGKNQGWTSGTVKRTYRGADALEAVRLAGEIHREFAAKKAAHPDLPFGGYYTLGVCNDSNAMIELALTGKTTLYPLTRDRRYFQGAGEVNELGRRLPVDGKKGAQPDLERILGSLPVDSLDALAFPELRADLRALADTKPNAKGIVGSPLFAGE